jgi:DNA replication and repair protein RecF
MAVVRGEGQRVGRTLLIEAEIRPTGRGRITLNRQPLRRSADLNEALRVSVFTPDDLDLVKEGPTGRRRYLDETLAALHPRHDAARRDFERVLRQRNALLAQAAKAGLRGPNAATGLRGPNAATGRPSGDNAAAARPGGDIATTLDVWDARLVETGQAMGAARADLVARLEPALAKAYAQLAPDGGGATASYDAPWRELGLAAALQRARRDELRRGVSLVGPHRDDLVLTVGGMPARTHASQGEQRSLALALRLAAHDVVTEMVGEPPLLLLDDVFSELDHDRSKALLDHLPPGQRVLTTTGPIPAGAEPERVLRVAHGVIT